MNCFIQDQMPTWIWRCKMFKPNVTGSIRKRLSRDVHGRAAYGPSLVCPFGIVNLQIATQKTSVRADSSASRGSADEITAIRGKILIPAYMSVTIGDRFEFQGQGYEIAGFHQRRSVLGYLDHFECDLEILIQ